jgi:hypothetical protein
MRALLLGENSKRQPAIQISTELKWLIDIGSVQGCAVGLVNGWRACAISLRQTTFTTFIVLTDSPAQAKAAHNNPRSSKTASNFRYRHDSSIQ